MIFNRIKKLKQKLLTIKQQNTGLHQYIDQQHEEIETLLAEPYKIVFLNCQLDPGADENGNPILESVQQTSLIQDKKSGKLVEFKFRERHIDTSNLYVTMIELARDHSWYDMPESPFNKIVLITRREYEKEFHFANLELNLDDGINVNGQAARCWFTRIATLPDNIPMFLSVFTERDVEEEYLHLIADSNTMKSLREKVLTQMVIDLLEKQRSHQAEILTEKSFAQIATKREVLTRKRMNTELVRLDNTTNQRMSKIGIRLTPFKTILLGAGWGVSIILLGILLGVVF